MKKLISLMLIICICITAVACEQNPKGSSDPIRIEFDLVRG